jgi:hypothetical protein
VENEMIRRFAVHLSNIEIINQSSDVIDPFVRFIIGGDFFIELKKRGDSFIHVKQGELGLVHMTNWIKFLESGERKLFSREIRTIYEASFFQLETERLHVEVWDREEWNCNRFLSYASIPLIDIVDGPMNHSIQCFAYNENMQPSKLNATINLKMNLAEIWDFYMEFSDWKTSSLKDKQ